MCIARRLLHPAMSRASAENPPQDPAQEKPSVIARPSRAILALLAVTAAVLALGIGPASARVTVSSTSATAGGFGEITFRVPSQSPTASTISLRVQLPTEKPLLSVSVEPTPGWVVATSTAPLDPPVNDGGTTVTQAVTGILWTAAPGAGIKPGQYQTFSFTTHPLPRTESLSFPTIQGYDDGTEVGWIQPTITGEAEPQRPAPVLELAPGGDGGNTDTSTTRSATPFVGSGTSPSGVAITALVLGIVAAVVGIVAMAVAVATRRRRRRLSA